MPMAAVVSLANAFNILQVAFPAAYFLLNGLYWSVSALNPFSNTTGNLAYDIHRNTCSAGEMKKNPAESIHLVSFHATDAANT